MLTKRATRNLVAFLFYRVIAFKVIIYFSKEHVMTNFEKLTSKKIQKLQNQLVRNFNLNEEIAVLKMTDRVVPRKLKEEAALNKIGVLISLLEDFELGFDYEALKLVPNDMMNALKCRLPAELFKDMYDWHDLRKNPDDLPPKPEKEIRDLGSDWSEIVCNSWGLTIAYNYDKKEWYEIGFDEICWYPAYKTEPKAWCHKPKFIPFPG